MSKLWSQIKGLFQEPRAIIAGTVGGWIGTGLEAVVLWKNNKPLGVVLGYIIAMAVCIYGAVIVAFFKEKARRERSEKQCKEQCRHALWEAEDAQSNVEAAEARRAFTEKLLEASEDRVRTLEEQLEVVKRRKTARSRQFKHYGGVR